MVEILIFGAAVLFILLGLAGSVLPIIPGPLSSWVGILLLHLTQGVPFDWTIVLVAGGAAVLIFVLDLVMPVLGTKKYGGSKASIRGCTIGIILGIIVLGPLGLIVGPFLGALVGELIAKGFKKSGSSSIKVGFGALVGFVVGTFFKVLFCLGLLMFFITISVKNWHTLF
ncbi:MAG: DUF456 domain-containing protein [Flavobacteriaceae bacterium]|nr:DUF456 domain-containing protein [Flavobacteriaceae bacterium]